MKKDMLITYQFSRMNGSSCEPVPEAIFTDDFRYTTGWTPLLLDALSL